MTATIGKYFRPVALLGSFLVLEWIAYLVLIGTWDMLAENQSLWDLSWSGFQGIFLLGWTLFFAISGLLSLYVFHKTPRLTDEEYVGWGAGAYLFLIGLLLLVLFHWASSINWQKF